jgi:hypothetical protein
MGEHKVEQGIDQCMTSSIARFTDVRKADGERDPRSNRAEER